MSNILDLESCSWPEDYSLETPVIKSSLSADLLTVGELKPLALKRYMGTSYRYLSADWALDSATIGILFV